MAEREGFEPSRPVSQPTRLAGERLQPLGHLSARERHSISQEGAAAILRRRNRLLVGLLEKPDPSGSICRGGPMCPPNRSDENTENRGTHRADTQIRPYENRKPSFPHRDWPCCRHSGESRNPFAGAGEYTTAFHSLAMAGTLTKGKRRKMDSGFRRNDGGGQFRAMRIFQQPRLCRIEP